MQRKSVLLAIATAIVALLLVAPFFLARRDAVPVTHDMHQHLSVLRQLDAAVRTGALYPRWQPEFNKGFGLPWLNYYPPAFYWFSEIFHVVTGDALDALFVVCVLLMIGSGWATYALAREFSSTGASVAAAAFCMMAPYHNLDLYWRGALAELAGFVFVPLILLLAIRAGREGSVRWIAALAIAHGVYLMTHIPVAYLLTLVLGAYALLWSVMQRNARVAIRIGAGVAWALVASAVYWFVATTERKHVSDTFSTDFPYHRSYIVLAPGDPFVEMLNASFVATAVALMAALFAAPRPADEHQRLFRILAAASIFMVTPYSIYIAKLIPNINSVSFAWRWLVIATVFVALAVGVAVEQLRVRPRAYALVVVAALALNVVTSVRLMTRAFEKPDQHVALSYVETGFVPGRAGDPARLPDYAPPAALVPPGNVEVVKWEPLHREVVVSPTEESRLHLRTYRFRGWTARVNGRRTPLEIDEHGAQVVPVGPGRHRVVVTYENPRTRKVLGWISVIAFLAAIFIVGGGTFAFRPSKRE